MFEALLTELAPFSREFTRRGRQIHLVGGAVRNLLLGRRADDYDFTTDALPAEVMTYFRKVLPTGIQHGTVTVLQGGQPYEVTTFRVDGTYTDGRRPDGVSFTPSLEEDLRRRDFTINALALDLADGRLHDFHGGRADLEAGILRAIGDPGQRFDEDALRILRLFRFAAQLGFTIDGPTYEAAAVRRGALAAVSKERIRVELQKALAGRRPSLAFGPLGTLGILADLFPSLTPAALDGPALELLDAAAPDLRWPLWLTLAAPAAQPRWEAALKDLKFSNADAAAAVGPGLALGFWITDGSPRSAAKAIIEAWGHRDRVRAGAEYLDHLVGAGVLADPTALRDEIRRAAASGEPVFTADLAVGGRDLMAWGVPGGPDLGKTLKRLQKAVWDDPSLNTAEGLKAWWEKAPR